MSRRTLAVVVAPMLYAKGDVSVAYRYRGKCRHWHGSRFFGTEERAAAIAYANSNGFTHVRFSVVPDWGRDPVITTEKVQP